MNGEGREYLLSSVASWPALLLGEVGRVKIRAGCLLPIKVGPVLTNLIPFSEIVRWFPMLFALPPWSLEFG